MNNKVSKFLAGITAFICAGVLSFVPGTIAKATVPSYYPVTEIFVYDVQTNQTTPIPDSVHWSFSGIDFNSNSIYVDPHTVYSLTGQDLLIAPMPNGYILAGEVAFENDLPDNASCTASFSFTYNGVHYSDTVSLSKGQSNIFICNIEISFGGPDNSSEFARSINNKINDIEMAFKGLNPDGTVNETKTVEYNYNYAISEKIIEKLAQADGVTLLYTFEYEGYVFTSTITSEDAAKIFSKDIPWYGPCYIASNCPTVMVGVAN